MIIISDEVERDLIEYKNRRIIILNDVIRKLSTKSKSHEIVPYEKIVNEMTKSDNQYLFYYKKGYEDDILNFGVLLNINIQFMKTILIICILTF